MPWLFPLLVIVYLVGMVSFWIAAEDNGHKHPGSIAVFWPLVFVLWVPRAFWRAVVYGTRWG